MYTYRKTLTIFYQIECVLFFNLAVAYPESSNSNHLSKNGRISNIIGGIPDNIYDSPWMAALFFNYKFHCSSGIVTRSHLVSAAHCFTSENIPYISANSFQVAIGEVSLTKARSYGRLRNVSHIDLHPDLQFLLINHVVVPINDIAVITMAKMLDFNFAIKPLTVPNRDETHYSYEAKLSGWGTTEQQSSSDKLLYTTITILDNRICLTTPIAKYILINRFPSYLDTIYCGYGGSSDGCQGDSGSPLVVRTSRNTWKLAGVMSWGIGCGNVSLPAVYTKTSYFSKWIKNIIYTKLAKDTSN